MNQGRVAKLARFGVLSSVWLAAVASAAPPPPAPSPAALEEPVDGYDMRKPFQLWRYWVESRKGPATEALLAKPDDPDGLNHFGPLLRFKKFNDFGHYMTGDIRAYCASLPHDRFKPVPGSCVYVLRRAYIPLSAASYGEPDLLSEWTSANFDGGSLARHFRAIGLMPGSDWWLADREAMFAMAPSPQAILTDNAKIIRMDSRECPQMKAAIETLEGQPLAAAIDFVAVGDDEPLRPPAPHATTSVFTLYLRAGHGYYSIEGSSGLPARMAMPLLAAADTCDAIRKNAD